MAKSCCFGGGASGDRLSYSALRVANYCFALCGFCAPCAAGAYVCVDLLFVHNLCGFVLLVPLELMKLYTIVVHALGWWRLPVYICARC